MCVASLTFDETVARPVSRCVSSTASRLKRTDTKILSPAVENAIGIARYRGADRAVAVTVAMCMARQALGLPHRCFDWLGTRADLGTA